MTMEMDISGRIRNLPLGINKCLIPVFEAVINSFESIEEIHKKDQGNITIDIIREDQNEVIDNKIESDVSGFIIKDNGIGLNHANYNSFRTADSLYKESKGGKGIGRFLWLKAFESINIESVFHEDGVCKKRKFKFDINGLSDEDVDDIEKTDRETVIILNEYKKEYQLRCPKKLKTIAERLIEHCIMFFLKDNCPRVVLRDSNEYIILNDMYRDNMHINSRKEDFKIKDIDFTIIHIHLSSTEHERNGIYFCANERSVEFRNLDSFIPNMIRDKIRIGEESFFYNGFIYSEYFDLHVNQERTFIHFEKESENEDNTQIECFENVSEKEVLNEVSRIIKEHLDGFFKKLNQENERRIGIFIKENPQYRPLLKYKKEELNNIKSDLTDKDLDIELHKILRNMEVDAKKSFIDMQRNNEDIPYDEAYKDRLNNYLELMMEMNSSLLSRYVLHRRTILDIFDDRISSNRLNEYEKEEVIHKIIFPTKDDSYNVYEEEQNLWLIDERLVYHKYLSSDKAIAGRSRPDLAIFFENTFAYTDCIDQTISSVVIIEFKRPNRDDYNGQNDPYEQVIKYIGDIKKGRINQFDGKQLEASDAIFTCYIIADLKPTLKELLSLHDFKKSIYSDGFYKYHEDKKAFIEVIPYLKLLNDAKKRNKILFDKLGL